LPVGQGRMDRREIADIAYARVVGSVCRAKCQGFSVHKYPKPRRVPTGKLADPGVPNTGSATDTQTGGARKNMDGVTTTCAMVYCAARSHSSVPVGRRAK